MIQKEDNMNILQQLQNYNPYNEQERLDKQNMINFIENNDDYLLRSNMIGHFTASCWIVNQTMDKVLMAYHNIYQSFSWLGGHADNETDLKKVSIKEAKEEANVKHIVFADQNIFSIETLCVDGHIKNGQYVSSHLHFNITYLLIADENDIVKPKLDENSAVKWIKVVDLESEVKEKWMFENIYKKLIQKTKARNK